MTFNPFQCPFTHRGRHSLLPQAERQKRQGNSVFGVGQTIETTTRSVKVCRLSAPQLASADEIRASSGVGRRTGPVHGAQDSSAVEPLAWNRVVEPFHLQTA